MGPQYTFDCGAVGWRGDTNAGCSETGRSGPCDEYTHERFCNDGQPHFCDNGGIHQGPVCDDIGLTCEAGVCTGLGAADCSSDVDHQGGVFYPGLACDGDTLEACVNSKQHRRDCTALGPGFGGQVDDGTLFGGFSGEC